MNSLQSLLLLNAIGLVTFGCVYSGEVIPDNVKKDILQLEEHYKTNDPILASGGPLFLNVLKYFDKQESGDKILLNEIVNVYIDILKNMKDTTEDQRSKNSTQHVYSEMEKLKARFASGADTLKELKKLWEIKTSDPIVQRKAILELKQVLEKAMRIKKTSKKHAEEKEETSKLTINYF